MENPILIFGATGLGRVALDIFKSNEVLVYGFLDDNEKIHGTEFQDVAVWGHTEEESYLNLLGKKCEAFVAIEDSKEKEFTIKMLLENYKIMPVNAIHQSAFIEKSAQMGHGNLLGVGVKLLTNSRIGNHCVLHANSLIDYDVKIGNNVTIGTGSIIANGVHIADGAFIGTGVTIISGVKIGKNSRIGAGSVVIREVKEDETVFGVPAQSIQAHHLVK